MRRILAGLAAVALAGAGAQASTGAPGGKPDIEYEAMGCPMIACPVYRIQLWKNGQGVFTGTSNTVIMGEAKFSVTEEQFSAFAGMLAAYRPKRDMVYDGRPGGPCAEMATDQGSVQVSWHGGGKGDQKLFYNYGCDQKKYAEMSSALANAPKILPVRRMISRTW